ncbi:MAG: hypothetical protein JWQ66_909 [Mucilaginibacter sp.]|nr:hypothetical protein [Mucilaginibacter sp.]
MKYHFLMRLLLLLFFYLSALAFSYGAPKAKSVGTDAGGKVVYPVPPVNSQSLFYVQRTSNTNTIVYDLNTGTDGKPDNDEPVKAYWIRYAEDGQKKDLSYIQRKFAYGLTAKALNNGNYDIRFVSYKKFPLTLMKTGDGKYHIFANIAQKRVIINRIFVKIDGGSFWLPNVTYVEVKGSDPITGREIVERFKP